MMYTFSKQDAQKHQEVAERLKAIFTGGSSVLKDGGAAGTEGGQCVARAGGDRQGDREGAGKPDSGHGGRDR